MTGNERPAEKTESLYRRTAPGETRGVLMRKAFSQFDIVSVSITLLLILTAGGVFFFFTGERIKSEMAGADQKMLEKVRSLVREELASGQASGFEKRRDSSPETTREAGAADRLDNALKQVKNQTAQLEEKLAGIRMNFYARSEKVREEALQLIEINETRVQDLEKSIEIVALDIKKLYESEEAFKHNARYEIQITYERGSEDLVDYLGGALRDQGFRISTWPNIHKIDALYGVSLDSLESKISVLPAPGEPVIGDNISRILSEDLGVPVVRTGVDKANNSRPNLVGLLIPPGCSLSPELMKSSVKREGFRGFSG